ncbi:Uncharacterised protein [Yersinia pseudotuberculosis]|uniref:Uncharacterized protein n=1 Tax=Yersinia pseudotuberculosis TaxID=633 RepID=A0A380Q2L5_YERPU|nr:Uncharacterised protein [Yersinia pseudotuberculosis]SUP80023.1 Uncharacterised protein [Yersinia pseudotuberculosis]
MSVYSYAVLCYAITAVISFMVMGVVVGLDKIMNNSKED